MMILRKITAAIIAALMVGAFSAATLFARDISPAQAQPMSAQVGKVVEIEETGAKKYIGAVEAIEDVTLRARVDGVLEKIAFIEGGEVEIGDILFEIEKDTYEAQYRAAEARVAQMAAELRYGEQNFQRQTELSKDKLVARRDLEEAERRFNMAKAQHAEAEFNLVTAKNNLSYATITAPIRGRISKSTYTRGNYLTPQSQPLATIVQISPIYVNFAMSEPDFIVMFANAATAQKEGVVRLRDSSRKMVAETGAITLVDNRIDPETGTVKIWATFANVSQALTPGGVLDAIITRKTREKSAAVKVTAVMTNKGGNFVYVVKNDNTVELRQIETGEVIGDLQVVTRGVAVGEPVVIDGAHRLAPGAVIIPVTAGSE